MVPVSKSDNGSDASFDRLTFFLLNFCKLFEMVVHKSMTLFFKPIIIRNQHSFVAGQSSITTVVSFTLCASQIMCQRGQLECIYLDSRKAFDVVDHGILFAKRALYGLCGLLHELLQSYLSERKCYVRVNGDFSS